MVIRESSATLEVTGHRLALLFVGLLVGMLTAALDQTIVATALPTIAGDLGGADHMLWITTAEVLTATMAMPVFGKLGDQLGSRKGLFLVALALLAVGSVICALAGSMAQMIAGRAVQGVGGGGVMILSQAIVADVVPPRVRGTYMGIMGVGFTVPTILGPLLGGFFTDVVSWHWAFWVNLPLVAVSVAAALAFLPARRTERQRVRFDVWGTVSMVGCLTALVLVTSLGGSVLAWDSPTIVGLVAACLAFGALFVAVELRVAEPIVPLSLFRNRNFVLATVSGLLAMLALMGAISYLPTFLQIAHGLSATASGYMEIWAVAPNLAASVLAGVLVSRTGRYKALMVAGFAVTAVGIGLFAGVTAQTSLLVIGGFLFVAGLGTGMTVEILVLIAQNEFPAEMAGTVTGANNFFREVGTTLGASLVGALFTGNLSQTLAERMAPLGGMDALGAAASTITPAMVRGLPSDAASAVANAYADALAPVFLVLAPLVGVGVVLMAFLKRTPLAERVGDSGHMG